MYGGGTSGDVPPPVLDDVICVGSIVAAFLRHASASLRDYCLPTLLLFHCTKSELNALVADSASEMRYSESNRATTVVCCGGAVRVVMFDILYASVYLKLNVGKWVASVTIEPGNLS